MIFIMNRNIFIFVIKVFDSILHCKKIKNIYIETIL
jgi:hypothetical protein